MTDASRRMVSRDPQTKVHENLPNVVALRQKCVRYRKVGQSPRGKVGQSSSNLGSKCRLTRPLTMPSFVTLRQKVSEISAVKNLCSPEKDQSLPKFLRIWYPQGHNHVKFGCAPTKMSEIRKSRPKSPRRNRPKFTKFGHRVPIGQTLNDAKFHRCGPNDVQEKRYKFYTLHFFGPKGPLGRSSPVWVVTYSKAPSITLPKFLDLVDGVTHTQTNKKQ